MANRHLSRSVVLQTLFEWDFLPREKKIDELGAIFDRDLEEFAPGLDDNSFALSLLENISKNKQVLDDIIIKAAPEWPIDKIAVVDRNVLRIGLAELLFGDRKEVPPKVAINEAIELAKTFGSESSGRFVNGVLGAVYKEIGEPGKDDISSKKNLDPNRIIPTEWKGGAVVYSVDNAGVIRLAMVHDVFGYWTLSKGGIEDGEDLEEGTKGELKEEIGLDIEIVEKLGENEYIAHHPEKGEIKKHVVYFLAKAPFVPLVLEKGTGGLDNAQWFLLEEILDLNMYQDVTEMITKSIEIISSK